MTRLKEIKKGLFSAFFRVLLYFFQSLLFRKGNEAGEATLEAARGRRVSQRSRTAVEQCWLPPFFKCHEAAAEAAAASPPSSFLPFLCWNNFLDSVLL